MPEDNESESQQPETKPDVPTPAGPISGGSSDISTHSLDKENFGYIRMTESDNSSNSEE